ncbi:MAG TPA: glycosyltransferase [Bacteroidales bacterium]|nr:glycosyltransferase [Bacteroidales bacterium]
MKKNLTKKAYFNETATKRVKWKRRNSFYHKSLNKYFSFIIPAGSKVLEIGCGDGELLNAVKPSHGVGVDFSEASIAIAREKFPNLHFLVDNAEDLHLTEKFDYIILSDLVGSLEDVQKAFSNLKQVSYSHTRIVLSYYNFIWEPFLKFAEWSGLKMKQPRQNWLTTGDIKGLLEVEDFESITINRKLLLPVFIPLLNLIFNKFLANLPLLNQLTLTFIITARMKEKHTKDHSVSILVPARNEKGNIENAIKRTPEFGTSQQFIFVEGNSSDGTWEEMQRVQKVYPDHDIFIMKQSGKGKGNAVREGFDKATGDILMILDADLTMPPEDLPKYYRALVENKGEFINGSRLVYPQDKEAMRFLNLMGNKFFSWFFTYLLGQRLRDTLCGTKVLFKKDYEIIKRNRNFFGDFDPFGDFDLIFGAAKLNFRIIEIPIRYRERAYGSTQISRFKHGWLLIKMSLFAARKMKFF